MVRPEHANFFLSFARVFSPFICRQCQPASPMAGQVARVPTIDKIDSVAPSLNRVHTRRGFFFHKH